MGKLFLHRIGGLKLSALLDLMLDFSVLGSRTFSSGRGGSAIFQPHPPYISYLKGRGQRLYRW